MLILDLAVKSAPPKMRGLRVERAGSPKGLRQARAADVLFSR